MTDEKLIERNRCSEICRAFSRQYALRSASAESQGDYETSSFLRNKSEAFREASEAIEKEDR